MLGVTTEASVMTANTQINVLTWSFHRLQEILHSTGHEEGRIPRTVECELTEDLVDACVPADVVTVCGIVKTFNTDADAGSFTMPSLLLAISLEPGVFALQKFFYPCFCIIYLMGILGYSKYCIWYEMIDHCDALSQFHCRISDLWCIKNYLNWSPSGYLPDT